MPRPTITSWAGPLFKRQLNAILDWLEAAGGGSGTIADGSVTNAKLADMATARLKGRATAGAGDPEDLTGTEATALLDAFTSGAKGLVPPSGGGTTNFLRADGTFAAPAGPGATGVATLDFGTYGNDATVDVTGQAGILVGSVVTVSVAAVDTAENTIDDIFIDPPQVFGGNVVAGTGFTIYGRALEGGLHGRINVNWNWR